MPVPQVDEASARISRALSATPVAVHHLRASSASSATDDRHDVRPRGELAR